MEDVSKFWMTEMYKSLMIRKNKLTYLFLYLYPSRKLWLRIKHNVLIININD